MKKIVVVLGVLLVGAMSAFGATGGECERLLVELDKTIAERERYIDKKYERIWGLKQQLFDSGEVAEVERFRLYRALTEEYIPFKFDSAYYYATHTIDIAKRLNEWEQEAECRITLANILMTGGRFSEAIEELDRLDSRSLSRELKALLYSTYDLTYMHRAKFLGGGIDDRATQIRHQAYIDSLRDVADYEPNNYRMNSRLYIEREEPEVAKIHLKKLLSEVEEGTRAYAIVAGSLAFCYELEPEGDKHKEYLIRSAISDIKGAVRENESLRQLSYILFEEGDIERAHTYISLAIADANFYDARLRCIEAANTYPIIQEAYRKMRDNQMNRMKYMTVGSILAMLIAVGIGIILINRMRALSKARKQQRIINAKLREMNEQLSGANHLKQELITSFLVLCSSYINKMERQQAMTHNLLSLGKINQLKEATSSSQMINNEIREFYHQFDEMVLKLFPNFVERINQLLRDEERITLNENEGLITELRIYALVCLGISDSSHIARFLRYSNNTVYTYRTKIRNKARDKEHFDEQVKAIGLY